MSAQKLLGLVTVVYFNSVNACPLIRSREGIRAYGRDDNSSSFWDKLSSPRRLGTSCPMGKAVIAYNSLICKGQCISTLDLGLQLPGRN
jgi:hypothetical protein